MYQEKIKPIQDNLLNKFKEINNILNYSYYDINKIDKAINKKYFSLIFSPSKEEIAMYNSFYHFENFGIMSYSTFALEKKVTLKNKLSNYIHFRSFIQYDHNWQYLKLDQYHMQLGKFLLYWYKWYYFKKNKVI